jgi:hypothetical protein
LPYLRSYGEEFDCQVYIFDDNIALLVDNYTNLPSFYGREDDHNAMVIRNDGRNICLAFTCMQIASTIASPANVHRVGNFAIGFLHKWIRAFLVLAGAPRHEIFPPFTSMKESLLHHLLIKSGSEGITLMLNENDLLPNTVDYLSPGEVGGRVGGRHSHQFSVEHKAKISQSLMNRECSN